MSKILTRSKAKTVHWVGAGDVRWDWKQHRAIGTSMVLIVVGAGLSLIPGLPIIQLLVLIQVLNGILLPIILLFLLLLANDRRLTGHLRNRWLSTHLVGVPLAS